MSRLPTSMRSDLVMARIPDNWKPGHENRQRGDEWRDSAACQGADPEIFVLATADELKVSPSRARKINESNFAAAVRYCATCEVKTACRLDAEQYGDLEYHVRGGITPLEMKSPKPRRSRLPSEEQSMPMAWSWFIKGETMARVRRAAKGPETGPWPEWEEYLATMLTALPRVTWGHRTGWLLGDSQVPQHLYVVMPHGDRFERASAPDREVRRVLDAG